jgi:hypothetical protein
MESFVQGWSLTIVLCGAIVVVLVVAWLHVTRERAWVMDLSDYLAASLVPGKTPPSLGKQRIRDEVQQVTTTTDKVLAQKKVREWQMKAQRLEPTLAFWVDLLRQLGLLGTVVGIGLSLAYTGSDLTKLLGPLALKVWTTVAGLGCSILLSARFSMNLTAWADDCEKNIEAWHAQQEGAQP